VLDAAERLKANLNAKIYVNGYCDVIGRMRYNQKFPERRADAVAAYLEDKGIPSSRLTPQGFGKTHFVAPNNTADGRARNRRVELVPADQH
jgi:OmpA-OmpF porin, OOP family